MKYRIVKKPLENRNILFQFTISLITLIIFSGCAKNIPLNKLSTAKITEKEVGQLTKKAEMQLNHFGNKCVSSCIKKKEEMLHLLDIVEDTVSKLNLDSSSMEMNDFLYTLNYIREEIEYLGNVSASEKENKENIELLKSYFKELRENIDEIYLVAEDRNKEKNAKFSLKKKIIGLVVQKRMGMHAIDDFGL